MARFYLSEIARMLEKDAPKELEITGFEQDSQRIAPGHLFFAFKGEKVDGHDFLKSVAVQGGCAAIVSKDYAGEDFGLALIRVENVLHALHSLARQVHAQRHPRVVAVTGSVGKTTTKEFIATLLQGQFTVAKTPGNANSQVSMPLSILNAEGHEEVFVIEMGMSEKGEMQRLVAIAPPEISVVTPITYAHVVFFPEGIDGIAYEKAQILSHSDTRLGIVCTQAAAFPIVLQTGSCEKRIYGQEEYYLDSADGLRIVEKGIPSPPLQLPFDASHLRDNFLAAALVARAMGMSWSAIACQALQLTLVPRRFEKVVRDGIVFINDSYNANATSMKAALHNLPQPEPGKKRIAVLGAMKELGEFTQTLHKEVGECALACVDQLLCMGEECQVMCDLFVQHQREVEMLPDIASMKKRVFEVAEKGDVVLLKGSRPNRLWQVLE